MKTDTGTIEEAGDCNDQKNYICEMPASVTSKLSIIYFYLKIIVTIDLRGTHLCQSNAVVKPD